MCDFRLRVGCGDRYGSKVATCCLRALRKFTRKRHGIAITMYSTQMKETSYTKYQYLISTCKGRCISICVVKWRKGSQTKRTHCQSSCSKVAELNFCNVEKTTKAKCLKHHTERDHRSTDEDEGFTHQYSYCTSMERQGRARNTSKGRIMGLRL